MSEGSTFQLWNFSSALAADNARLKAENAELKQENEELREQIAEKDRELNYWCNR